MTEVILGLIIFALIGYIVWSDREQDQKDAKYIKAILDKESKYIKAILAKDLTEMVNAEMAEKVVIEDDNPPDFVPAEDLDDDTFDKMIKANQ